MKTHRLFAIAAITLGFALPCIHAENAAPLLEPVVVVRSVRKPPTAPVMTTQPLFTLPLPANSRIEDVAVAVANAFTALNWAGIFTNGNTVTATQIKGGIRVKATAATTATEVKFYAQCEAEGGDTPEHAEQAAQQWLEKIERTTKDKLGLQPKYSAVKQQN